MPPRACLLKEQFPSIVTSADDAVNSSSVLNTLFTWHVRALGLKYRGRSLIKMLTPFFYFDQRLLCWGYLRLLQIPILVKFAHDVEGLLVVSLILIE
jgi:hypothetical protein